MAAPGSGKEMVQFDHRPEIIIASWVLYGISVTFVLARFASRKKFAQLESGDILLPLALVLVSVQTLCIQLATNNGFGQPYQTLESQMVDKALQILYWSQLIYILTIGMTKLVIALLVLPLDIPRPLSIASIIVSGMIVASTTAFIFGAAFQCHLPTPWTGSSQQCIDKSAFWQAFYVTTITTDLLALCLPLSAILAIDLNRKSQLFVGALFASRLMVPALLIVVFVLTRQSNTSQNPLYDGGTLQIYIQAVINTSIITACIPPLGTVFADVALGLTGRRMVPRSIEWGRYSPPSMTRSALEYGGRLTHRNTSPDKIPLCSGGRMDQGTFVTANVPQDGDFAWVDLGSGSRLVVSPGVQRLVSHVKQVHFADAPSIPLTPPSNHYPDTEIRSTTLDLLADYTYSWHPGRFENPTMPPPPVPPTKPEAIYNPATDSSGHRRGISSVSAQSRISAPSFIFSSTLITPQSSRRNSGERHMGHRPTRSSGSLRSVRSSYNRRDQAFRKHRSSQSLSILPSYLSSGSSTCTDTLNGWEGTIYEEGDQFGNGSFVDLDEEFDRCRRLQTFES